MRKKAHAEPEPGRAAFSPQQRAVLLRAWQMGPKMIAYLEAVGVTTLSELAQQDPGALRVAINAHLGRPHINAMGERALANAVACARSHLDQRQAPNPPSSR